MSTLIDSLAWRYAVKKYDATKSVSKADIATLKKAIQYSPSSMGLQPYTVLVISNPEIKSKLAQFSMGNQPSVENASHLFVFASIENLGSSHIGDYMSQISAVRGVQLADLDGFKNILEGSLKANSEEQNQTWVAKQIYLALGNLLTAAAELRIDATPMEGFFGDKFDEVLGLKDLGLKSVVISTVGYRAEDDLTQHFAKVRKSDEKLFIEL